MRPFLSEKLLRLTGYSSWDLPRVQFIHLAGEEPGMVPEETKDEELTVTVVEVSEPKETKRMVILADVLRTVELVPGKSRVGSGYAGSGDRHS